MIQPCPTEAEVADQVAALFASAQGQVFTDGMESAFSRDLVALVQASGPRAVNLIGEQIMDPKVNSEVASEALRWVGRLDHAPSWDAALAVLTQSLLVPSARIRDGAIIGLALLDDPRAIPALAQALSQEPVAELRKDIEQVLAQLREQNR